MNDFGGHGKKFTNVFPVRYPGDNPLGHDLEERAKENTTNGFAAACVSRLAHVLPVRPSARPPLGRRHGAKALANQRQAAVVVAHGGVPAAVGLTDVLADHVRIEKRGRGREPICPCSP